MFEYTIKNNLALSILNANIAKLDEDRMQNILDISEKVKSLEGDVIECGVFQGGMGMFLADTFKDKTVWLSDSYKGFAPGDSNYKEGAMAYSLTDVKTNFERFNISTSNVKFLEGYVQDTLPTVDIDKLALLRIDVDSYSATTVVLEHLWDKVVEGGYIIFDDSCLPPAHKAVKDWYDKKGINLVLKEPVSNRIYTVGGQLPCGCYTVKDKDTQWWEE